jgi:DNA-binding NarL/FixJ family response regulator
VAVVDDHPLYRQGVVHSFESSDKFVVLGEGASSSDAVGLVAEHEPDLLLLDLHLPGGGLEAAEVILAAPGTTKVVVLSAVEDIKCVVQAFRIGVSGYLLKGVSGSELIRSAEAAAAGEPCVAPQLLGHLLGHVSGRTLPHDDGQPIGFAAREEQILALLAKGMSNKEIAYKLGICENTAKCYLTNIMKKLRAKNRVEVAVFAAQRSFNRAEATY